MIYCDTSVLLSLYVGDDLAEQATQLMAGASEPVVWTGLHKLEFFAGLEARVGRDLTQPEQAFGIRRDIEVASSDGGFLAARTPIWEQVYQAATDMALSWGAKIRPRSLDVLHVALCRELGVSDFLSLDDRQGKLAQAVGLRVNPRDGDL